MKIMAYGPISSRHIDGQTMETVTDFILGSSKITAKVDSSLLLGRKAMTNLGSILKKQRHYFANKCPSSQSYGFSSSHVRMWELDHWCFWTVVLETILESLLGSKEIKLVNPKGNQSLILIGRSHAEVETPILWPSDAKHWLLRKDPDAGKDWRQEKGMTEDEMFGWYRVTDWMDMSLSKLQELVIESEVRCPLGRKELDTMEGLNWRKYFIKW